MQTENLSPSIRSEVEGADRAPGVPLLGFLAGTLISLALWLLLTWSVFHIIR